MTPAHRDRFTGTPGSTGLESGQTEAAGQEQRPGFLARVVGPHFESLCRTVVQTAGEGFFGTSVGEVGAGIVNDQAARGQIEVDVVAFAPAAPRASPAGSCLSAK